MSHFLYYTPHIRPVRDRRISVWRLQQCLLTQPPSTLFLFNPASVKMFRFQFALPFPRESGLHFKATPILRFPVFDSVCLVSAIVILYATLCLRSARIRPNWFSDYYKYPFTYYQTNLERPSLETREKQIYLRQQYFCDCKIYNLFYSPDFLVRMTILIKTLPLLSNCFLITCVQ